MEVGEEAAATEVVVFNSCWGTYSALVRGVSVSAENGDIKGEGEASVFFPNIVTHSRSGEGGASVEIWCEASFFWRPSIVENAKSFKC